MQNWDIYEITTENTPIHGVMFRGRIRKYAIENEIELLTENANDIENAVLSKLKVNKEERYSI